MIAKIKAGVGFAGLVSYANDIHDKDARILHAEGVSVTSNATVTASFKCQADGTNVKKFVGHLVLSFSPLDLARLNDELMVEIAQEYMRRMEITDTQYVIYRHNDKAHPHLHIVYNRVNNRRRELRGDQNFRKSAAVTKALTREYGLAFGRDKTLVNRDRLRGKDKAKYHIYDSVRAVLPRAKSWDDLRRLLAERGIGMQLTCRGDLIRGVSFSYGNVSFAGGRIDRSLTCGRLYAVIYENEPLQIVGETQSVSSFGQRQSEESVTQSESKPVANPIAEPCAGDVGGSAGGSSQGGGLLEAAIEIAVQPHVAPSAGGGGGGSNDRDDDEKDKNKYRPRRRR